jgi:membrane-bound lytic murein transglycosylase B
VVVAIWGLESAYGAVLGDIPVVEALATLAYDGRRRAFAEEQLLAALRILQSGDVEPAAMRGSWAGAMGHTQFIPTSYLSHAVDFTGDGRRDIWAADPADALASTASYLAAFGWQTGAPAVRRVVLPEGFDYRLADQSLRRPVPEWRAMGVRAAQGALPGGEAAVLLPAGADGPAWLAYGNFRVIRRYNNATSYALAVALLAEEIDGRRGASRGLGWPRGERPLSRSETEALQRALTGLGFDTGGADGIVGPNTRAAVRAFQEARGLTPDGYVTAALLEAVRAAGG